MFTKIYTEQLNLPETMVKTVEVGGRGRDLRHYGAQISKVCCGQPTSACCACLPSILSSDKFKLINFYIRNLGF